SFKTILDFATHSLRERWPSDLDHIAEYSDDEADKRVNEATQTILLAQECNLPELLKAAYYELLHTPEFGQELPTYVYAEPNDTPTNSGTSHLTWETDQDEADAPKPRLAASDFVRLEVAKFELQNEWLKLARAPPLPSTFPCPLARIPAEGRDEATAAAKRQCSRARKLDETQWAVRLLQNSVFDAGLYDFFEGIQQLIDMDWKGLGYCVGCVSERRDAWEATGEKLWKRLDVLLGLKGEDEQ
ncbi:hypothetical protein GY45DRAFT_1133449, partial [Cubamyces sp. BRFM 1775]